MPLFKCTDCGAVENTALGNYWASQERPTCSECDTGQWHGRFEKIDADESGYVPEDKFPQFITKSSDGGGSPCKDALTG